MSDPFAGQPFPRAPLIGAGVLVALVLASVTTVRLTGVGAASLAETAPVIVARSVVFEDRGDGSVVVRDSGTRGEIEVIPPGRDGFLRATMRSLAHERRRVGAGPQDPFRISRLADGHVTLEDTATGRRLDLAAFGPTNAGAFARLLPATGANQIAKE